MKRSILRILAVMAVLCLALVLPNRAEAASYSGTCGTNVSWSLDTTTGLLNISGSGNMTSYSSYTSLPWYNYRTYIKTVKIGAGVSNIGNYSFYGCTNLTEVTVPATVLTIGTNAFYNCTKLARVNYGATNQNWTGSITKNGGNTPLDSVYVYCSDGTIVLPKSTYPQSAHNYTNNTNETKTFSYPGATKLEITFASGTKTEANYDYIYVYDGAGNQISKYSGTTAANKMLTISGDSFKVKLTSDGSNVAYGYAFSSIVAYAAPSSGSCGTGLEWEFNATTGNLAITGSGAMTDYASGGAPWFGMAGSIQTVTLDGTVTSIGAYALEGMTGLTKVTFDGAYTKWSSVTVGTGNDSIKNAPVYFASGEILLAPSTYPESAHPYANNANETQTFTWPGAKVLTITFSSQSEAEEDYDYIYVYDGTGKQIAKYDDNAANKTLTITGDTFKVKLTSDESSTEYGYSFSKIIACERFGGALGDTMSWEMDDNGKLTITGEGAMPSYSSSNWPWYSVNTVVTSVVLDSRITSIGQYAFYNCTNLTSINIPEGVTSIGTSAFYNCSKLTSVTLPSTLTTISGSAFSGCSALTSITIPENVTSIGTYAFQNCKALTRINYNATSLAAFSTSNQVFSYAGNSGTGITVTIGANVKAIPAYLFCPYSGSYSPSIKTVNFAQGSVCTTIGSYAFAYNTNLTSVSIPEGVTSIGASAFYNCSKLTSVTLPSTLTTISGSAFSGCSALTSVSIPAGVTTIGTNAFGNCRALTGFQVAAENATFVSDDAGVLYSKDMTRLILAPGKLTGSYTVPEGVTSIDANAFQNCTSLTSVTLPDTVTTLGNYVFSGCSALTSVTLGSSITDIPGYAFSGCSGLTEFVIPNAVKTVGTYAFQNCTGLKSLTIGRGVKTLNTYAFYNCTGLTEINIEALALNNLSSNNYVFYNAGKNGTGITVTLGQFASALPSYLFCPYSGSGTYSPKITSVKFAEGQVVKTIGQYTFAYCTSLTSFETTGLLESIGQYAFYNCTGLKSLTLGANLETLSNNAFYGCTYLEQIHFNARSMNDLVSSNSVFYNAGKSGNGIAVTVGTAAKRIPAYLFCPNSLSGYEPKVKSLSFDAGSTCTEIGAYAFYRCTGLTTVTLSDSVTTVGTYAFYNCTSLTTVSLGKGLTGLGKYAFSFCTAMTRLDFNATAMPDLENSNGVFYNAGKNGTGLTVNFGAEVTRVPGQLFNAYDSSSYAPNVTAVNFAQSSVCTEIGEGAFEYCSKLPAITLPDTVTTIGSSAFFSCSSLTSITMPESLEAVGSGAFSYCSGLSAVYVSSLQNWCAINFESGSANPLSETSALYVGGSRLTELEIPYGVTSVGSYAFYNCFDLTGVTLPSTLKSIGEGAFYNCAAFTGVYIPSSVIYIGPKAFFGCVGLAGIWVEDGNPNYKTDSYGVLYNKSGTELLAAHRFLAGHYPIPAGVEVISESAFRDCLDLTELTVPASVTSMGYDAFFNCPKLKKVNIADLEAWCAITFANSYANPLRNIETLCINGVEQTDLVIPEGVQTINDYAFKDCGGINTVTFPTSLTSIGTAAFSGASMTQIRYNGTPEEWAAVDKGSSNSSIANASVYYTAMGALLVPASQYPQSSHNYANNANETKTFTWEGAKMLKITFSASTKVEKTHDKIYVYDGNGSQITYYTDTQAAGVTLIIPGNSFSVKLTSDSSTTYYGYSFSEIYAYDKIAGTCGTDVRWNLDDDGKLTISGTGAMTDYASASSAPWYTFRSSIKAVEITDGVTNVGKQAFYSYYPNLSAITLAESVSTVGSYAFYGCDALTSLTLPGTVTTLEDYAFAYCDGLTDLTFSEGLTKIGKYAFVNCPKLTAVEIPASVELIDTYAFGNCNAITGYTVHADNGNYSSDASGVLFNKDKTTLIMAPRTLSGTYEIPAGVTTVGANSFQECKSLTAVTIPDTVTVIDTYAFYYCSGITAVRFPASLETVGSYAFYSAGVTDISYAGTGAQWGAVTMGSSNNPLTTQSIYCEASDGYRVPSSNYPQSAHNYGYYTDETKTFTWEGAKMLSVTFNDKTFVEANYDYIYLYIGTTGSYFQRLTGDQAAGKTFLIPGDTFRVGLSSNGTNHYYGYAFSSIVAHDQMGGKMGDLVWSIDDAGILSITGTGAMEDYAGNTAPWYDFRSYITGVAVGEGVTTVGSYAFSNLTGVTSASIADSVTEIKSYAFNGCSSLTDVSISESLSTIGNSAFAGCSKLTTVEIPASVTEIGSSVFAGCSALTGIHVEADNAVYASDEAGVLFNKDMTLLIQAPRALAGSYTVPSTVTAISDEAFYYCSKLTEVTIPESVTTIGANAFYYCSALTTVSLSEGLAEIGEKAFYSCSKLTAVEIPATLHTVGKDAFLYCGGLTAVRITDLAAWCNVDFANISSNPLYIAKNLYLNGQLLEGELVIPAGVTTIAKGAFYHCTGLTSVAIPESVTTIDQYAFSGCTGLTSVTIPESVTTINQYAFNGCTGLTSVTIPESVTTLGASVFSSCTGLTSVTIPGSVATIGSYAFSGCTGLTSVTISKGVTTIGSYAFRGCTGLTNLTIPEGVTTIGSFAFHSCSKLSMAAIPNTVKVIDSYAFAESALVSVTIPDSVTRLGNAAFNGCTSLVNVSLGAGVSSLESDTFRNCTALREIRGKNSVNTINEGVFNNCTSLVRALGMDSVTYVRGYAFYNCAALKTFDASRMSGVGEYAFYGCAALEKVFLGDYTGSVGQYAFYGCTALSQLSLHAGLTLNGYAFAECPNIKTIYFYGWDSSYTLNTLNFGTTAFSTITATVYYPVGCSVSSSTMSYDLSNGSKLSWVQVPYGTCGYNSTWSYNEGAKTLTISGTGGLLQVHAGDATPWAAVRNEIQKVYINDGIIALPKYCFEFLRNAEEIRLPNTLEYLAPNAFNDCEKVNNLLIPATLREMESGYHFNRCKALTDIYYVGTLEEWKAIPGATVDTYERKANLHTLQLHPSTATCGAAGNAAYYDFGEGAFYTNLYNLDKTLLTAIPTAPATGNHTITADEAVAATCTETGLTAGSSCKVCGYVEVAQEAIPALGHSLDDAGVCTNCSLVGVAAVTADGTTYHITLTEAIQAAAEGYVVLRDDVSEDVTASGDCWLDLNGFTLTGDITVEDGSLYLFDSATADYTAANRGKVIGEITGDVSRSFNTPALYGHNYKYLVLQEEDGSWSAHRYYLTVKSVVVAPVRNDGTAVNYRTVFKCNELVARLTTAYGAKLTGDNTVYADAVSAGMELAAGTNTATTALTNTLSLNNSFEVNAANALAAPTVNAYIVIDGMELTSADVTMSLQELLVKINARTDLSYAEERALGKMYAMFREIIDAWEVDLAAIKSYIW